MAGVIEGLRRAIDAIKSGVFDRHEILNPQIYEKYEAQIIERLEIEIFKERT